MSLKIGQIRKNQYASNIYRKRLDKENEINNVAGKHLRLKHEGGKYYPTGYYALPGGFQKGVTYHIRLNVGLDIGTYSSDKVNLKLVSAGSTSNEAGDYYMQISTFTLWEPTNAAQTRTIEATFTPNFNYPYLVFEIQRDGTNEDKRVVLKSDINSYSKNEIYEIYNIIPTISSAFDNVRYFKKIGIQGSEGLQFNINGEGIQLGKSGMFELEGINITSIAFSATDADFFILDFQY